MTNKTNNADLVWRDIRKCCSVKGNISVRTGGNGGYLTHDAHSSYVYYRLGKNEGDDYIDFNTYNSILIEYFDDIIEDVLNGETELLGFGLGSISVTKKKLTMNRLRGAKLIYNDIDISQPAGDYSFRFRWEIRRHTPYLFRAAYKYTKRLSRMLTAGDYNKFITK